MDQAGKDINAAKDPRESQKAKMKVPKKDQGGGEGDKSGGKKS